MAEEINKTYTSNSLYNDSTGVIAFAEQLKQELINWANYHHVTEELGPDYRPDTQSALNNLFLSVYERFLTFLNDADATEEAINTWKEIERFLADYTDEKTLAEIVAELNANIESRLTVPLESTTGSSTTSTMTQKAITETIEASKTFTTGEKVENVGIDDEPTAGSNNLVKSGGAAINNPFIDISHVNAVNGTDKVYANFPSALADVPAAYRKDHISVIAFTDGTYRHIYQRKTAVRSFQPSDWRCIASDIDNFSSRADNLNFKVVSSLFGSINNLETSGIWVQNGTTVSEETSAFTSFLVYIPKGITSFKIENCTSVLSVFAFVNKPSIGDSPSYTATKTVEGTVATITLPSNSDGVWNIINLTKNNNDLHTIIIRSDYNEIHEDVEKIKDEIEPITINSCGAYITNTGTWATGHATIYGALISVNPGDVVTIVSDISTKYYSVLKSDSIVSGSSPDYATGYSGRVAGMPNNTVMPSDAAYIWFAISWGTETLPSEVIINGTNKLSSLPTTLSEAYNMGESWMYHRLCGKQAFLYKSANEFIVASKFNGDSNYDIVIYFGMCLQNSLNTIFSFKRVAKVPNTSIIPNADVEDDAGETIFTQSSDCILATRFNRYSDYHGSSDADRAYASGFHALSYNGQYYKTGETKSKDIIADGVALKVGDYGSADEIILNVVTDAYNPFVLYDSLVENVNNPIYSVIFTERMAYKVKSGCIDCVSNRKFATTCYMETYGGFASMSQNLKYGYFPNGEGMENQQTDKFGELTYNVGTDIPSGSSHTALKYYYPEFSHFIRRNADSSIFESLFMSGYGSGDHSEIPNDYAIYWVYNATGLNWKKVYHRVTYKKSFAAGDRQKLSCLYSWFIPFANTPTYIVYNAGNTLFIDVKSAYNGVVPIPNAFIMKGYTIIEKTTGISNVGESIDSDGIEIESSGEGSVVLRLNAV